MLDWKNVAAELKNRLDGYERRTDIRGAGVVLSAGDGVVQLDGLGGCKLNELLEFDSGAYAIVMNLEEDRVGAVLLGNDAQAAVGMSKSWLRFLCFSDPLRPARCRASRG